MRAFNLFLLAALLLVSCGGESWADSPRILALCESFEGVGGAVDSCLSDARANESAGCPEVVFVQKVAAIVEVLDGGISDEEWQRLHEINAIANLGCR